MILDMNALSAWADGQPEFKPVLVSATKLVVPAVVLGEFDFGIRQSRHYRRYTGWLERSLRHVEIAAVDEETAKLYGQIRLELNTNHEKFFDFSHPSVGSAGPADRTHSPERQRPAEPAGPTNNALPISPRPFGVWYKKAGTPIPLNDAWIAAAALQFQLPVVSRDAHFDAVASITRVPW